jgi:hypothetical protein
MKYLGIQLLNFNLMKNQTSCRHHQEKELYLLLGPSNFIFHEAYYKLRSSRILLTNQETVSNFINKVLGRK